MKVEKKLTVVLDEKDIESLQICLDFCNILEVVRRGEQMPKGYANHQIKKAYEIYEEINEL